MGGKVYLFQEIFKKMCGKHKNMLEYRKEVELGEKL